jgi:hypothetical protein
VKAPASFSYQGLDEDQLLIAKLMEEEEDALRAQELQNDYYMGNRPPTAKPERKKY